MDFIVTDDVLKRVPKTYRSTLAMSRAQDFDATLVSGFDRRGLKFSIDLPIFVASRRLTRPLDVAKVDARAVFQNVPVGIKTSKLRVRKTVCLGFTNWRVSRRPSPTRVV